MAPLRIDPADREAQLARFARVLRRERRAAGLSQEALGKLAGLSQSEVSMLEMGRREPGILTVAGLARALHMSASDLLRELR
jgi:transcriptional regulator with XRE-family HTH domain